MTDDWSPGSKYYRANPVCASVCGYTHRQGQGQGRAGNSDRQAIKEAFDIQCRSRREEEMDRRKMSETGAK
jgi:hypothetical protein